MPERPKDAPAPSPGALSGALARRRAESASNQLLAMRLLGIAVVLGCWIWLRPALAGWGLGATLASVVAVTLSLAILVGLFVLEALTRPGRGGPPS